MRPSASVATQTLRLSWFLLSHFAALVAAGQDGVVPRCYYPDGTLAPNDYACKLNTTESFCCTYNVTCLDNKICAGLNPQPYKYNRGTCTDKTWQSDECPKYCLAQSPDYGCGVVTCRGLSGSICCDNNATDATATCCQDDTNLFALAGNWDAFRTVDGEASSSTRRIGSTTATSPASASASSSPSSTNATTDANGGAGTGRQGKGDGHGALETGAIVGIAVGGAAGVVAAALLALWWMRRRRRSKDAQPFQQRRAMTSELDGAGMRHEMSAKETRHEMGEGIVPQELSSDERHELEGSSPLDAKVAGMGGRAAAGKEQAG